MSYAVQQFFANGGAQAYVVRVPHTGAIGATVTFANLIFTALSSGAWANGNLLIDIDYNGVDQTAATGEVTAFNLTIANLEDGTVEPFPSVSLNLNKSSYVLPVVNDPDTGSQLANVALVAPWPGGNPPANPPVQTGLIGAALPLTTVNNTAVLAGVNTAIGGSNTATTVLSTADFGISLTTSQPPPPLSPLPLDIKVFARNGSIPQTVAGLASRLEQTINATLAVNWPSASVSCSAVTPPGGTNQAIRVDGTFPGASGQVGNNDAEIAIAAPSVASLFSDASTTLGFAPAALTSTNVAHYTMGTTNTFGSQTASGVGTDGSGLPGTTQLVGDQLAFTGIYALLKVDQFNLLSIPDATRAAAGDPNSLDPNVDPNSIYGAAITLCEQSYAMLLVDAPPPVRDVTSAVDWKTVQLAVHSPNGAAYFPRLRLPDPANNYQLRTFSPSGVVAGLYARIDGTRGVWKAPAGTEATLTGVQAAVYKLSDPENGVLNPLGLNCFRIFPIYGAVAWGARTLVGSDAEASQWKYVPVRRLALYIEESLYRGTKWAVFEPNDEPLWAQLRLNIGAFMHNLFQQGAFQGSSPSTAYLVKCDQDTTTQNDIDAGVVNVLVGFAPLKPAEFVVIQIQQLAGQLQT
ncbi:MAG TPA: phage tail sheath C-terminal domain-containing protein [Stellaceae bacterium]|nr:phage tail sheath C-terminal domain-containing protein [Stellaceae bacterium]